MRLINTIGIFRTKTFEVNQRLSFPSGLKSYDQLWFRQSSNVSRFSALSRLDFFIQQNSKLRYALLIDGKGYHPTKLSLVISEISSMGITMPIRRIYNSVSSFTLADSTFGNNGILDFVPVKSPKKGKNIVDIAIIMDAMDLLHQDTSILDGFILVSSASELCPLAKRLRQAGKHVIGIGEKCETATDFPRAFDHFIFSDQLELPEQKTQVME